MKIYKSEKFGKIQEPEDFNELLSLITSYDDKDDLPVRMWRGQSNVDWGVDSSGYRRVVGSKRQNNNKDWSLTSYEKSLLEQATHKGYRFQNGRELYDLELLSKLQHHGVATRLVDFSRSALVALWFCISGNQNKTGLLLGVHSHYIGGYESHMVKESYIKAIKSCEKFDYPITFEPSLVSPRIAAQHAQFLYSKVSDQKTGSLYFDIETSFFVAITPKLKLSLETILTGTFDLRITTLFPDLDGFGMGNNFGIDINRMYRW
jgi:hypothetical protein